MRSIVFVSQSGLLHGESRLRHERVALNWRHGLWPPMFQRHMPACTLSAAASAVARLLYPVLQYCDLVEGCVAPNAWLGARPPVTLVDTETDAMRHAAQADRFLLAS